MRLHQGSLPVSIADADTLCQHYLTLLYADEPPKQDTIPQASVTETYGEILCPSVNKLISLISLTEQDIFVDLGSSVIKRLIKVVYL